MKQLKYMALAAVTFVAAACNNDYQPRPEGSFEVTASAECTGSRTTIAADNSLTWSDSDALGIYVEGLQNNRGFYRSQGLFKGSFAYLGNSPESATFRAYYPYTQHNNGYRITAVLPSEQNALFDGSADFMISEPLTRTYAEDSKMDDLAFNFPADGHLFTVLRLTLADGDENVLANEYVSSVRISSEGNVLAGTFNVDMRDASNVVNFTDPKDYVNLTFESGRPTLANPVTVYAVVRPTDEGKPISLTIEVVVGNGKAVFTSPNVELKRSTVKELPTIVVADKWIKSESENGAFLDEKLLSYLIKNYDSNNDGLLSATELETVTELSISSLGVTTLAGLEKLPNLVLLDCSGNEIPTLDLSGCTKLSTLIIDNITFANINLSKNAALRSISAQGIVSTDFNLSGCTELVELNITGANIDKLTLDGLNKFTTLYKGNVSRFSAKNCKALNSLELVNIGLNSLDLTGCTALLTLDCYDNAELSSLTVKGCTALTTIMTRQCAFTSLDLSGLRSLVTIYCQRNNLSSVDLTGCVALSNFYAHTNKWVEIDLSSCTAISSVNVKDTPTCKKIILPAGKNASIVNHEGSSPQIVIGK